VDFTALLDCQLVAFDLETTGVSPRHDIPVSYGFVGHHLDREIRIGDVVNPGRDIPVEASKIHGITNEMVQHAATYDVVVPALANQISEIWRRGGAIVGMNVGYDLSMIQAIDESLGHGGLSGRGVVGPVIDVMAIDRHFDQYRKGKRTLGHLCDHYGVSLENAHGALDDAAASLHVLFRQIERYPELKEFTLDDLGAKVRTWYLDWKRGLDKYFQSKGEAPMPPSAFEWPLGGSDEDN
jgi:DNA polymerase-3 subunit alpha/DNA polymerase-3 subunit epsilon